MRSLRLSSILKPSLYGVLALGLSLSACNTGPALSIKLQGSSDANPCQNSTSIQAIRIELKSTEFQSNETVKTLEPGAEIIKAPGQTTLGFQGPALQKILRHCAVELGYASTTLNLQKVEVTFFDTERKPILCGSQGSDTSIDLQNPLTLSLGSSCQN
ncbi:MAG: hypothetical protein H6728_02905 [Myxococcales bacterium]|nr:hypothetical protein [Myxococcales bacterium]MCB9642003.1 hypothetical protein [Myxococcales bacterium]